jgi:hypothetical protein
VGSRAIKLSIPITSAQMPGQGYLGGPHYALRHTSATIIIRASVRRDRAPHAFISTVRLAKSYSRRFVRTFLSARGALDERTNGNTRWRSWRVRGA